MSLERTRELYKKYRLGTGDYFQHKNYVIITRQGIEKIQAVEKIVISYEVITCSKEFCVLKALAILPNNISVETFGSALYGVGYRDDKNKWVETGTTNSWYVMEVAEKRALSRAVLKLTGLYSEGVYGEDESDDFIPKKDNIKLKSSEAIQHAIDSAK